MKMGTFWDGTCVFLINKTKQQQKIEYRDDDYEWKWVGRNAKNIKENLSYRNQLVKKSLIGQNHNLLKKSSNDRKYMGLRNLKIHTQRDMIYSVCSKPGLFNYSLHIISEGTYVFERWAKYVWSKHLKKSVYHLYLCIFSFYLIILSLWDILKQRKD